jgi:hypothetical protein
MPNDDAAPIIIFIASVYAFGIVLLYVLARAWEQALSTRPRRGEAGDRENIAADAKKRRGYQFIADDEFEGAS